MRRLLAALAVSACLSAPAGASGLADRGCAALAERVAGVPGGGPVFLRSYERPEVPEGLAEPALRDAAFTYDNALAAIALTACGRPAEARRVGEALRLAAASDRHWRDGRVRNAYRAGPVQGLPLPPGWYDQVAGSWQEDAYLVGTQTGNVAWAALAMLTLHGADGGAGWLAAAKSLMGWVANAAADASGPGGYAGGFQGHEPDPQRLGWKSTEHNLDAAAAFAWLERASGEARWRAPAAEARRFVAAMWEPAEGRFLIGTGPDGVTPDRTRSGLDAQLWPLLAIPDGPAEWRNALDFAGRAHGVPGGYDFDADRDGLWVEGTAQAALALRAAGRAEAAAPLLAELARHASPHGLLFATREERLTTGLAVGPASTTADFLYYRHPHVGATAWAVLAALGWNPFTGRKV